MKALATFVASALLFALPAIAQNDAVVKASPEVDSLISIDPSLQMALGGGTAAAVQGGPGEIFNVAAHSGPLGVNARGHAHVRNTPGSPAPIEFRGDVTCLTVVGNVATMGGMITDFEIPGVDLSAFHGFFFSVQDNKATGVPDEISQIFVSGSPPTPGACPFLPTPVFPVWQGNVVVRGL